MHSVDSTDRLNIVVGFNNFLDFLSIGRGVQKTNQLLSYDSGPWKVCVCVMFPAAIVFKVEPVRWKMLSRVLGAVVSIARFDADDSNQSGIYIFVLGWRGLGRCPDNEFVIRVLDLERLAVTESVKLQNRVTMREAELARTLEELITDGIAAGLWSCGVRERIDRGTEND